MRYRLASTIAAVTLVVTSLVSAGDASPALAQTVTMSGVYSGPAVPAGVTNHDSFAGWLGDSVPYAVEFLDTNGSWDGIANPYWALDAWSQWSNAQPGRRLVLSVPLLVSSASGQLAQGAGGAFDANFVTLSRNMVARNLGSSVIRLGWEMNHNGSPWWAGNDPASFRSFYARVVTAMRSVPGAAFTFDWNPNLGVQGGSPLTTFDSFYPGDAYVDVIGLDIYDIKWMDSTSDPAARWNWMMTQPLGLDQHRTFAAAHGKPVSFPEWGLYKKGDVLGGGGDNPYFVHAMADWISSGNTTLESYFNVDWGGGTLDSFPNAKAAYKLRFGASATALTVSNVRVTALTSTSAVITWTSSASATSEVDFGKSVPSTTVVGLNGVTSHIVTLVGLTRITKYVYQVRSDSSTQDPAVSPVASFTTLRR